MPDWPEPADDPEHEPDEAWGRLTDPHEHDALDRAADTEGGES
jgi:hypothetical protein